jgi:cardiolipin synthase
MVEENAALDRLTPNTAHGFTPPMNPVLTRRRSPAWTLANCLTYGRLVAVPVVVALLYWPDEASARFGALGVFILAAITDYLDGYVARTYDQSSALGRMLDPIADKLVILCREILVSGLREYLAELKVGVPVSRVAKWKTTLQLVAIGFLVAGPAGESILPGTIWTGTALLWIAAALTLYTGWDYMRAGIKHVIDDPR